MLGVRVNGAGRVRCEPTWRLDRRWSERLTDYDLWFVWAGRGRMELRDRAIELRPGVLVWMRPGGSYCADQDARDRLGVTYVHFDLLDRRGPLARRSRGPAKLPAEVRQVADVPYVDALTRRVVQAFGGMTGARAGRRVADQLLRGLLMDLDASEDRATGDTVRGGTQRHHHRIVMRAAARLSEDPVNAPPIAELAREAGCTPDHLGRLFGKVLGTGPQAYLVQSRINRARQLLTETGMTISQVAEALGYCDVYFFSRQFKQKTGMTPSAYRWGPWVRGG